MEGILSREPVLGKQKMWSKRVSGFKVCIKLSNTILCVWYFI